MGILSGPEIHRQIKLGNILIEPFDPARLGPNSYDVCLGPRLVEMEDPCLDITKTPKMLREHQIYPSDGFRLRSGCGYLGHTVERIWCRRFVPTIDGRSTLGRYFVQCHQTAGRGDEGWGGQFTVELAAAAQDVIIYAGIPIFQMTFFDLIGEGFPYRGRYQDQEGPTLPKPFVR